MLKAIIIGCAICAGAGGTALWMKSDSSNTVASSAALLSPISIQQMHSDAHLDGLPVQTYQPH
jgi:hypothetical protein